jgi:hypothetical protein
MSPSFQKQLRWIPAMAALSVAGLLAACGGGLGSGPDLQAQSIAFTAPADQTFGSPPVPVQAFASSGLDVSVSSSSPAVCEVTGGTVSLVGVGRCDLTAEQLGNDVYEAAPAVAVAFQVVAAPQTINFVSPGNQRLGTGPVTLMAAASSGLDVSFVSTTPAVCDVDLGQLVLLSAGTCSIDASQAGSATFAAAVSVTRTIQVDSNRLPQSLQFPSPGDQILDAAPLALAATATSGLPVDFSSLTPAVCTVEDGVLTLLSAGTCTIVASQDGDAVSDGNTAYAAAQAVSNSFSVLKIPQSLSFASPGPQTLGVPPPPVSAQASSGLNVTIGSATPDVCAVSGNTLTLLTTGDCTLQASQAGDDRFAAAPVVSRTFAVAGAAQTISFDSPGDQTLGTAPSALVGTASSGLPVSFSSSTPAVCAVNGSVLTLVSAGNCSVQASQPGNASFAPAAPVVRSFTVADKVLTEQTISFTSPGEQTLGTAPFVLSANASSGLTVSLSSTTPAVCTVSGATVTLVSVGNCTIEASQAGNDSFAAAPTVTRSFAVAAAPLTSQSISFTSPGNQVLGVAPPPLSATASSGLTVTLASSTPAVCTVSGTTLGLLAAGNCVISASQAGDATYAAAPTVSISFTVSKASQSISFTSPGSQVLGVAPPPLAATASSGLPVSFSASTPAVCTVSGSTLNLVASGNCSIVASQAGNATFNAAAPVTVTIAVGKASQTISFASPGNQTLGTVPSALVATASSGLPVVITSNTPAVCTVSGNALALVGEGACSLSANQSGSAAFLPAPAVSVSFAVAAMPLIPQTISFTSPGDQVLGTAPAALAATASSGLPVSFASSTSAVCTVSGTTLTLVSAGTCTVEASQAGNGAFMAAATVSRSFAVAKAAQTISFTSPGPRTLGTGPFMLDATASSGLPVSFTSTSPAVCSVSGSTLTLLAPGSCAIQASQAGNAIFAAAPAVALSFEVAPAVQSINFASPGNQTLGAAPFALQATATSGLPVSFSTSTPGVCSVTGNNLSVLALGVCTVHANQAGNASFAAAPTVSRSFSVVAVVLTPQTISFTSPGNQTLGSGPVALVATASSGLPVSLTSASPAVCAVSGNSLSLLSAGTCTVNADQAGNTTFAAAPTVSVSVAVAQASQSISFPSPGNQVLGTGPVALTATASSGLPVSFGSSTPAICTVSGSSLSLVAAGTCTVTANQAGNAIFAPAATVSNSVVLSKATQTISFAALGDRVLGSGAVTLSATASSGLPVSFASTTLAVCTVSGNSLTLVTAGACSITASQAGNATFAAAPSVSNGFTVTPAAQSISFTPPANQTLGSGPVALVATASSGLPVSFSTATPGVCTVSGSNATLVAAGICTINANQLGNANVAPAAQVTGSFQVAKAVQSISFTSPGTQTLGTAPPPLAATATSGLVVVFSSSTPAVCTVSGTSLTLVAAGNCSVDANQPGNATFAAAATVTNTFAVQAASQTISFPNPGSQTLGGGTVTLSATASSGLPVTFASSSPAVCEVSGSTLTLVSAGACTVLASQPGNANFAAAPTVSNTFSVNQAAQTISFPNPGSQTLGGGTVGLSATASSGLPVSFSTTTPSICTVVGSTLTLVSAGTCSVQASQAGNAVFAAAVPVANSFTVSKAAQTISFSSPGDQMLGSGPITVNATASSGLAVSVSSDTPGTCTVSGSSVSLLAAGTCTLSANQAGNAVFLPAPVVVVSFTITAAPVNLIANGGFEDAGTVGTPPPPAAAWLSAAAGYTRSNDARTGAFAARLNSPAFNAAVMVQNSVEQGGRPPLTPGSNPILRFWAKGTPGATGSLTFALRYLDSTGVILSNSMSQNFGAVINTSTWTEITFDLGVVPANATAAFIEFSQAIGPVGTGPAGEDWFAGDVLIDDLSLTE